MIKPVYINKGSLCSLNLNHFSTNKGMIVRFFPFKGRRQLYSKIVISITSTIHYTGALNQLDLLMTQPEFIAQHVGIGQTPSGSGLSPLKYEKTNIHRDNY